MLSLSSDKRKASGPAWSMVLPLAGILILLGVLTAQNSQVIELLKTSHHSSQPVPALAPVRQASYVPTGFFVAPRTRNDIGALLEEQGFKIGVELGVQRGFFSAHTLHAWSSCVRYYLVDVWEHQPNYEDFANVEQTKQNELFAEAQGNLAAFKGRTVFLRNFTSDAVKRIKEQVDYVYVDARHDYCGVLEDIELYWPLIKSGGIMAGHDYLDAPQVQAISQQNWAKCMNGTVNDGAVKGAVDDFFRRIGLPVHVTYQDAPWSTWVVVKP